MEAKYPLAELIDIKKRRFDIAVKVLEDKKRILAEEEKKLQTAEKSRDKALEHKNDKLNQLRESLDTGESTDKVQQKKRYLKIVEEKLQEKQKKVDTQKVQVKNAKEQVEAAKIDMIHKQKDIEKLNMHKKEWERELAQEIERKEAVEQDELGSAVHELKKRKRENPKKS